MIFINALIFIIPILAGTFIIRLLTTIIHELGHAIPAIIFTGEPVTIYIGSYGDDTGNVKIRLGKLHVLFKKNFFYWLGGMCHHKFGRVSIAQTIIILFGGAVLSFIVALVSFYFAFTYNLHDTVQIFGFIFLVSAVGDLFFNLAPSNKPQKLHSGGYTYNDGYWIRKYIKLLFQPPDFSAQYQHLTALLSNHTSDEFLKFFDTYFNQGFRESLHLQNAIHFAIVKGDFKKTKIYLYELKKLQDLTENEYALMAYAENSTGNYAEAENYCREALKLRPDHLYTITMLADIHLESGNFEYPLEQYNKLKPVANKRNPDYYLLGIIAAKTGKIEEGIEFFEKALELDPLDKNSECFAGIYSAKIGLTGRAKEICSNVLAMPSPTNSEYINCALIQSYLGNSQEAIQLLLKALETDHTNFYALNNMSNELNITGRYEDALDYAEKGLSSNPNYYYLYNNKGFALLMLGQQEEGKECTEKAMGLNPRNAYAHRNMGIYYKNAGQQEKATECLLKAYELDRSTPLVKQMLAGLGVDLAAKFETN